MTQETQDCPSGLSAEALAASQGELPATAGILEKVQQLLRSEDSTTNDVADLLVLDPAMASRIIRIANSAVFQRGESCRSLEEALMRIGFSEIREVVNLVLGSALMSRPLPAYGLSATQAWHEAVGCAVAAALIAEASGEDSGLAYTVGLFSTIGRGPINAWLVANAPKVCMQNTGFPFGYAKSERLYVGATQAAVAGHMLLAMKFSPELVEPVRKQDDDLLAPELCPRMRYVLTAARMVYDREFGEGGGGRHPLEDTVANLLGLSSSKIADILPEFRLSIERAIEISYC